ncbi:MAG: thioredoxin family protein [Gammaproteobacteria bacterium]|nr:thioredoxin family protein [Gammaproteobacteria bacterium]
MHARQVLIAGVAASTLLLLGTFAVKRVKGEAQPMRATSAHLKVEGELPPLEGAISWINSPPLMAAGLRGKVVLVDFWTYTCINWRRTLPYIQAWAEKYRDHGLVVIGVHTPEFSFEKELDNVRRETSAFQIHYPVAVDSEYAIWRAFHNQYWPALYIADAQGHIRHHQFGEGGYAEIERAIQELLTEAGRSGVPQDLVALQPNGAEKPADWSQVRSPESYVGYELAESFASPGSAVRDRQHTYTAPERLALNDWALVGAWTIGREAAVLQGAGGRIVYRFHARDLNLIMGPAAAGNSVKFRVTIDGEPPGAAHGLDIDEQGNGTLTSEPRMYQLIRQPGAIGDRLFEIEFTAPGVAAFDFTFG